MYCKMSHIVLPLFSNHKTDPTDSHHLSRILPVCHEFFSRFGTVFPGLGDNYASKCGSDSFSHTEYLSPCVEISQNHTLMLCFSSIPGRRFEKQRKLCPIVLFVFQTFSPGSENFFFIKVWFWEFSTRCDIYFVCGKLSEPLFDV